MAKKTKDKAATVLGVVTSLVMALALVDFDTIDLTRANDVIKILVLCLPAIGGTVSEIKGNSLNDQG